MAALAILIVIGMVTYMGWLMGRQHEIEADYWQEQKDYQAYEWAIRHNRLPTETKYVDSETGEVL